MRQCQDCRHLGRSSRREPVVNVFSPPWLLPHMSCKGAQETSSTPGLHEQQRGAKDILPRVCTRSKGCQRSILLGLHEQQGGARGPSTSSAQLNSSHASLSSPSISVLMGNLGKGRHNLIQTRLRTAFQ